MPVDSIFADEAKTLFVAAIIAERCTAAGLLRGGIEPEDLFESCLSYALAFCSYAPTPERDTQLSQFVERRILADYGKED